MKNRITVSLPFSFKGELLHPKCTIDLDEHPELESIPSLYTHLAYMNGIDVYSHEYDVMMMGTPEFEAAEGIAAEFLHDGIFDIEGFWVKWHEIKLHNQIQDIATRYMGIKQISKHDNLKKALLEAYRLGMNRPQPNKEIQSTTQHSF